MVVEGDGEEDVCMWRVGNKGKRFMRERAHKCLSGHKATSRADMWSVPYSAQMFGQQLAGCGQATIHRGAVRQAAIFRPQFARPQIEQGHHVPVLDAIPSREFQSRTSHTCALRWCSKRCNGRIPIPSWPACAAAAWRPRAFATHSPLPRSSHRAAAPAAYRCVQHSRSRPSSLGSGKRQVPELGGLAGGPAPCAQEARRPQAQKRWNGLRSAGAGARSESDSEVSGFQKVRLSEQLQAPALRVEDTRRVRAMRVNQAVPGRGEFGRRGWREAWEIGLETWGGGREGTGGSVGGGRWGSEA